MTKEKIKIHFVDFWPNFIKNDNYFYHLLQSEFNVVLTDNNPDLLFFSVDYSNNKEHLNYQNTNTKKIFYTGENIEPNYEYCDGSISFISNDIEKNYRLPLWALHINWFDVKKNTNRDQSYLIDKKDLLINKTKTRINKNFCSFLASNPSGKRLEFIPKLLEKRTVDCGGKLFNNINKEIKGRGDQKWKIKFLSKYRFNIAFENEIGEGYVTEKIIQPMSVRSIPIYWGSNSVSEDFNKNSFINLNQFQNDDEAIDFILKCETDRDLYESIFFEPWFRDNEIPKFVEPKNVLNFIKTILN